VSASKKKSRQLFWGIAFLAPNIIGFLSFTLLPLVFALILAFTNWDLRLHNRFQDNPLEFVGLDNFLRLWTEPNFWRFLGNTLFFMMNIPLTVGGSLLAAIMLSKETRGGGGRVALWIMATAVLMTSCVILASVGAGVTALTILFAGVAGGILIMGTMGGTTVYRTLFYTPHFVVGVPTMLVWKKMYAPETGPINTALTPVLDRLGQTVNAAPAGLVDQGLMWVILALMLLLVGWCTRKLLIMWRDGDVGSVAVVPAIAAPVLPVVIAFTWLADPAAAWGVLGIAVVLVLGQVAWRVSRGRDFTCINSHGFGNAIVLGLFVMVICFICTGLAQVMHFLPEMAVINVTENQDGLKPPSWLQDPSWAKPALMIMGFWGAVGSNNMLLYLAALTNVPGELYEAADIDGASRFQKFWNVTWPQLAPTTFFILVMAGIHGLQGGFEMAKVMTNGGPAGATTTLSFFIYQEGFETGRLGYSSGIAWTLFLMVLTITLINWKFGNKYVND